MTPSSDAIYLDGLKLFSSVVARFQERDWERRSPCSRWSALDVLGHVGMTTRFGIDLLSTGSSKWRLLEEPGAAVGGDPGTWWSELAISARRAVERAALDQLVETPAGIRSVADGLNFPALDLFVHGWDLGHSARVDVTIPDEVISFGQRICDALPGPELRGPSVFADEVPPPSGASSSEVFLAWTGRDPRWTEH